jgi:NADH:ubiquinone oxidoreductase subunit 6 (subunit J)
MPVSATLALLHQDVLGAYVAVHYSGAVHVLNGAQDIVRSYMHVRVLGRFLCQPASTISKPSKAC